MEYYNLEKTIYFGTRIDYLSLVLTNGITKPSTREEKYISVSVSGYSAPIDINCHKEVNELAHVYLNQYKACVLDTKYRLQWKNGYNNSMTSIDGFGPSKLEYFNVFGQKELNTRKNENIALVINNDYFSELIYPSKSDIEIDYNYLSLALHPFISQITSNMVDGIIVSKFMYDKVNKILNELNIVKQLIILEEMEDV
jgi:hypothetical protein